MACPAPYAGPDYNIQPGPGYPGQVNDLLLIDRDPRRLRPCAALIDEWLKTHRFQCLNPTKTRLVDLDRGITYLGTRAAQVGPRSQPLQFFPTGKKKWKLIQGLRKLAVIADEPVSFRPHPLSLALPNVKHQQELASINSRLGSIVHTQSYGFRKKALERFKRDMTGPLMPLEMSPGTESPFVIKEGYRALRLR